MPYRPGAGRPRGSRKGEALTPKAIRRDARKLGLTPLDFLLKVMRDPAESTIPARPRGYLRRAIRTSESHSRWRMKIKRRSPGRRQP